MKSINKIYGLIIVFSFVFCTFPHKIKAQGVTVGFQAFYDDLSPYGSWVDYPDYGYVWYPSEGAGFSPYGTNGYWVLTDFGWTWYSFYVWGWAPFHYGRWFTDPFYGPMWVPGYEWGPGWVAWRQSAGFYGWCPIAPGISIEVAYSNSYYGRADDWRFVRDRDFGREHLSNYYVDKSNNKTIMRTSSAINNTNSDSRRNVKFNSGPSKSEVEKHTGRTYSPLKVKENSKPGQAMNKGEFQIYRPQVQKSGGATPKKFITRKDNKSPAVQKVQPQKQSAVPQKNNSAPIKSAPIKKENPKRKTNSEPVRKESTSPEKEEPIQPKREELHQPEHKSESPKEPVLRNNYEPFREEERQKMEAPMRQMPFRNNPEPRPIQPRMMVPHTIAPHRREPSPSPSSNEDEQPQ